MDPQAGGASKKREGTNLVKILPDQPWQGRQHAQRESKQSCYQLGECTTMLEREDTVEAMRVITRERVKICQHHKNA
jgi:hypothetical protein